MASDLPLVTMNIARRWFAEILAIPRRKKIEYRAMSRMALPEARSAYNLWSYAVGAEAPNFRRRSSAP
jgi:hypothetical protein